MFWKIPSFISVFMVNSNRNQTTILVYQIKNSYCPLRESTNSTSKFEESYGGKTFLISHNRSLMKYRNSHPEMIRKISVLKNYAKFIWKHLSRILFPMTLCRSRPATITAKNTAISPNFLVWKFCGNTQFPHSFGRIAFQQNFRANCPKLCGNCPFPQNFHTRKLGGITVFFEEHTKKQNFIADSPSSFKMRFSVKHLWTTPSVKYNTIFAFGGLCIKVK